MSDTQDFKVIRSHTGDKFYKTGSTRTAKLADVAHLIPNCLEPMKVKKKRTRTKLKKPQKRKGLTLPGNQKPAPVNSRPPQKPASRPVGKFTEADSHTPSQLPLTESPVKSRAKSFFVKLFSRS